MEPLSIETAFASIQSISQEISGSAFEPFAVYFNSSIPTSHVALEAGHMRAVHFEAHQVLVSHTSKVKPQTTGGQHIVSRPSARLEAERPQSGAGPSLVQQVRGQIAQCLSEGVPTISDTARRLGMSGRTLQRKLSRQGYAFQTLVDQARRQVAERLLQETDYSLSQIAFMTGYSEQSAFTRAFKRWAGQTPRAYRLNASSSTPAIEHWEALSMVWQMMPERPTQMLVVFCA